MSAAAEKPALPGSLNVNRSLGRWVGFDSDGTIAVRVGKVEIGQGILTALAQIAADELDVGWHQVRIVTATTESSPNEGMTSGSRSVEESGEALRYACAEVRALFLQAVARYADERYEIWSHSQGIFPLRGDMVKCLRVPAERIVIHHVDGSGCYGHNGADDVALDAALLARAVSPRPVKVQWMREDEMGWEPFGPAMVMKLAAAADERGNIVDWKHEVWSNPHSNRSGRGPGSTLIAAPHLADPVPVSPPVDMPLPSGASHRNAIPLYDFPNQRVARHLIHDTPLRISALRALGGFANVFAIESMLDELAAACGADPVEYRLRHLKDPRARAVIERAAQLAGWKPNEKGDGSRGRGIGFCKYKNLGSYCAVIAEVVLEKELRVTRAWAAVDVGRVVNPDGVGNQIEGGIVQATSWTLKEAVRFDTSFVTSRSWDEYPILTFAETPRVEVVLVDRPGDASKGAGEGAQGPTGAAIANALYNACGVRVRELPLSRERIAAAMR